MRLREYAGGLVGVVALIAMLLPACIFGEDKAIDQNCDAYCTEHLKICTGANAIFSDKDSCLTACGKYPRGGREGDTKGDTLQCRVNHLEFAISDPTLHCAHSGPDGAGVCVANADPCASYCALALEQCNLSTTEQYADEDECRAQCATFRNVPGEMPGTTSNTVQCRLHILSHEFPGGKSQADACADIGVMSTSCVDETTN